MSDDRITTTCPACSARMRVPDRAAGKRVRCPKCNNAFTVEVPVAAQSEPATSESGFDPDLLTGLADGTALESPESQRARLEAKAAQAARARVRGPEPDHNAIERSRFDWGAWIVNFGRAIIPVGWAGRVCFAAIVLGCVLIYMGFRELGLRSRSRAEPQVISCERLVAQGPGDNLHMILTDFVPLSDYVYQQKTDRWSGAWVPIVPPSAVREAIARVLKINVSAVDSISKEQEHKALKQLKSSDFNFKIIISLPKADGEDYVERALEADSVQGMLMVDSFLATLNSERRELLQSGYPRADLNHCWVLVEGRTPASEGTARGYQAGGLGLILVPLVVAGWRAAREARSTG